MGLSLDVRSRMNGASSYDVAITPSPYHGVIDASSTRWWGVVPGPSDLKEVLRAAEDILATRVPSHINVKETFALYEVLRLLVKARLDFLRVSTITLDAD